MSDCVPGATPTAASAATWPTRARALTTASRVYFFLCAARRRRGFGLSRELFVGRRFFDYDWRSRGTSAMRSRRRRFLGITLIRSAFRTYGNRLSEVVKLRVAAVTGVLSSKVS